MHGYRGGNSLKITSSTHCLPMIEVHQHCLPPRANQLWYLAGKSHAHTHTHRYSPTCTVDHPALPIATHPHTQWTPQPYPSLLTHMHSGPPALPIATHPHAQWTPQPYPSLLTHMHRGLPPALPIATHLSRSLSPSLSGRQTP